LEFLFAGLGIGLFALILFVFPFGFYVKGKLILITLVLIINVVGLMANTFLNLGQTVLLLFVLVSLFSYLTHKRAGHLFVIAEERTEEKLVEKRYVLPVRPNPEAKLISFIEKEAHFDTEEIEINVENLAKESSEAVYANTKLVQTDSSFDTVGVESPHLQKVEKNAHGANNLDEDLEAFLNRTAENEVEPNSKDDDQEVTEEVPFSRDLEAIVEEHGPPTPIKDEKYNSEQYSIDFEEINDRFEFIEEIDVKEIDENHEKSVKEVEPYSSFDVIDELNELEKKGKKG
jgi:hypothetical protein